MKVDLIVLIEVIIFEILLNVAIALLALELGADSVWQPLAISNGTSCVVILSVWLSQ